MNDYPLIADHGLIGDLQTAALVAIDGSVDWLCLPRFDSPSVFGSLLDSQKGGYFRISPGAESGSYTTKQLYLPDTAILITRFMTEAGVGEIVDFMPPTGAEATQRHRLVRMVRCVRGQLSFDVDIAPRFDYGRQPHTVRVSDSGAVFTSGEMAMTVHAVREPDDERLMRVRPSAEGDVSFSLTLEHGQLRGLVLEWGTGDEPRDIRVAEFQGLFDQAAQFWRDWLAQSTYRGRWREAVERSAITLKLMTYAPSGALVAAPTAGLPEQIGGERNWDYRYTWVRDGAFSIYALLSLGFTDEAAAFGQWLHDRVEEKIGGEGGPLHIMYRIDGSSDLTEDELEHWEGYRQSYPVRIGNGASDQLQLDIYGELMDSVWVATKDGSGINPARWTSIRTLIDWLAANWDRPEEGIWETRGGRKHFTYGRLMSWVAFDRAIKLADMFDLEADTDKWAQSRDAVREQIMTRGWNDERHAFVQHFDDRVLDASLLRMPLVGFLPPDHPQWLSTLRAMDDELVEDSLVYRYDPAASPDGLLGDEGTFSLCTFNYVDALARSGRLEDARLTFQKMLTYANHVGLYGEEIGLTGEQLGNFPQAFTHLALIDAAISLDSALSRQPVSSTPGDQDPHAYAQNA